MEPHRPQEHRDPVRRRHVPQLRRPELLEVELDGNVSGSTAALDATFVIGGYNSDASPQSATVSSHVEYVLDGGSWLIQSESWSFTFAKAR